MMTTIPYTCYNFHVKFQLSESLPSDVSENPNCIFMLQHPPKTSDHLQERNQQQLCFTIDVLSLILVPNHFSDRSLT